MSQFIEMIAFSNDTYGRFWDPRSVIQCPYLLTCCGGKSDKCPYNENCFREKYKIIGPIFTIRHTAVEYVSETAPPMSTNENCLFLRMYLYPIDADVGGNIFGIFTHHHGSKRWLLVVPTAIYGDIFQVGTVEMDFPPSGPHPTKFFIESSGSDIKRVRSVLYNRYLRANVTNYKFSLVTSLPDDGTCDHVFHSATSTGPVMPVKPELVHGNPPHGTYQFFILAHNGMALTASTTAPYLTVESRDFDNTAQRFFFRCVNTPLPASPANPFTYNMYSVTKADTVYCVTPPTDENTGGIHTVTILDNPDVELANPNVEFAVVPATDPSTFVGRFMIRSFAHGTRLRASGASVPLVDVSTLPSTEDYFSFVPFGKGLDSVAKSGDVNAN
eukprot:GILI01008543.1.p1 GENE.GILI01008543.1~~GILI01008543.1.p1  ORF type:complete len:386 (+),score=12.98 GILI01008543.1:47-1204(+)